MKIILHCGAHKTASTHLQYNLKRNRALLKKYGVVCIRFHAEKEILKQAIKLRNCIGDKDFDLSKTAEAIRGYIEGYIRGYEVAILTYEGVFGDMDHWGLPNIYPKAETVMQVYKNMILKDHDVTPVYAIRNYDGFFRSTYKWKIKKESNNFAYTLDDYLTNINFDHNRWTQIVEHLDDNFSGQSKVYTFEDYKTHWKTIIYKLIDLSGKEVVYDQLDFEKNKRNVSGGKNELNYHYTRSYFKNKVSYFLGKGLIYKVFKNNPALFSSKIGKKLLLPYQKEEIPVLNSFEKYQKEAAYLKKRFGLLD